MALLSENWGDLLEPGLRRVFFQAFGRRASMVQQLFSTVKSTKATEHETSVGAAGSDGWNFEDTGTVQYVDYNQGYRIDTTNVEFARGIQIQRKLLDDDQYNVINRQTTQLADSAFVHREKAGAGVFINAFTDSGTTSEGFAIAGYDSVGLCSDAHPYSPADTGTTQSNEGTYTLTKDNVSTVRNLMMAFTDDQGDIVNVMPNMILVPPELEDDALVIVKSVNDPASANNAINPQSGRFVVVVWHYLTDANAWFMIDRDMMKQLLMWYDRIGLEFKKEENFDTLIQKFRAYMRYSRTWVDYHWLYGNNPS